MKLELQKESWLLRGELPWYHLMVLTDSSVLGKIGQEVIDENNLPAKSVEVAMEDSRRAG